MAAIIITKLVYPKPKKQSNAIAVNLNNKRIMPEENEDEESGGFRFLKKHIKYKVSIRISLQINYGSIGCLPSF